MLEKAQEFPFPQAERPINWSAVAVKDTDGNTRFCFYVSLADGESVDDAIMRKMLEDPFLIKDIVDGDKFVSFDDGGTEVVHAQMNSSGDEDDQI